MNKSERMIMSSFSAPESMLSKVQAKCARMGVSMAELIRCKLHEVVEDETGEDALRTRVVELRHNEPKGEHMLTMRGVSDTGQERQLGCWLDDQERVGLRIRSVGPDPHEATEILCDMAELLHMLIRVRLERQPTTPIRRDWMVSMRMLIEKGATSPETAVKYSTFAADAKAKGGVGRNFDPLQKRGWIEWVDRGEERASWYMYLTPAGRAALDGAAENG